MVPPPMATPAMTQSVANAFLDDPPGFRRTKMSVVARASGTAAITSVLNPMPNPAARPDASAGAQRDFPCASRRTTTPHNATAARIHGAFSYSIGRPVARSCKGDHASPAVSPWAVPCQLAGRYIRSATEQTIADLLDLNVM